MLKYVFMGTPQIAADILDSLVQAGYKPALAVTQPAKAAGRGHKLRPTPVAEYCQSHGIECLPTPNANDEESFEKIRAVQPDILFVVAFGQLLKKPLLELAKFFPLNVHASLLPKYRGAAPVQWALINGDSTTGVTVQRMVKKLDAGDIFVQDAFSIENDDTTATLWGKIAVQGATSSLKAFKQAESGAHDFQPQDPNKVTYAPKITKEMALIQWDETAIQIRNKIRAFQPWPVAETQLGEDSLRIFSADVIEDSQLVPAEIQTDHKTWLHVGTGQGGLSLTEIQLANRKRLQIREFLSAYQGSFPFQKLG